MASLCDNFLMSLPPSNNTGLHVRYEIAGLILDALPIPWNADAVIVEANVRLPAQASRDKQDFTLCLASCTMSAYAELIAQNNKREPLRVFFRLPVPQHTTRAEVRWREHSLGQVELPVISQSEFENGIALDMPSLHVTLGGRKVACRSFVGAQAKGISATGILRSATPLGPALNQELRIEVCTKDAEPMSSVPLPLSSAQLRLRQALLLAPLPKLRSSGTYRVSWHFGSRCLSSQALQVVTKTAFARSLRVSATRFVMEKENGATQTVRSLPTRDGQLMLDDVRAIVPVFYVSSGVAGMAGLSPFTLRALVGDVITTLGIERDMLVTDVPTPIVLGAVAVAELERIKHFALTSGETVLGNLPLVPAPQADLNAEGGFAPLDDFLWSPAAEEELTERLGKLLDGA